MTRTPEANRILIGLDPLRSSRDFRLLFAGQLVNMFGGQLTRVALPFQVYELTRSSLQVGAISLAQLIPLVVGALVGGSLGDAMGRRRVLVLSSSALFLTSAGLALNASVSHPSVLVIYLVSALGAGLGGIASTVCNAAVPALVGIDRLIAAYTCMQVVDQVAMVLGPAISGVLIGSIGVRSVYAIDAITCLAMAVATACMSATQARSAATRPGFGHFLEGLRFLKGRQALQGAYLVDLNATVFGLPRALFPALAITVFHGGAQTLGWLYAAPGAGALVGALSAGWLGRIRRQAAAVLGAVCVWGAAIAVFGFVHVLWFALALLAVAGWADVVSAVLRTTILQAAVPEGFRSRISALQIAVVEGGPRLGDLESGGVAAAVSTGFSVVSGGLACIAGALILAAVLPGFRRYRSEVAPKQSAGS